MPCGTGKSLTAFWIAEALEARNILVAVPSLALIRQSLEDWTREYLARGQRPDWLCVCSDESVGAVDTDSFVAETYDLGIPTTTNRDEIVAFLAKRTSAHRITFTTYQSSRKLSQAARDAGVAFDLAVLDEAHKTVGVTSKIFATLLRDDATISRHLFMTATERVLAGDNDDVVSMDDQTVYGERFFQLTFKQAIAQDIISDYRILTLMVSDEQVQEIIRKIGSWTSAPTMWTKQKLRRSRRGSHLSVCSKSTGSSTPSRSIAASEPPTDSVSSRTGSMV